MGFTTPQLEHWARDFSAGFLDTPEEDTLAPGATPDARNGDLTRIQYGLNDQARRANIRKRRGSRLLNPVAMDPAAKVDGLFEFRRASAAQQLVAVCNGKVKVFDNIDTFAQVGATAPFTAGAAARVCLHKSNAFIFDGIAMKRYDGTSLLEVGFAKPTSVTNMTAVAPVGAGVTGTYEAYYVWYDQTMDHESSPSATTATVAPVAQARRHTKPGGAPPANVTHWRAYVRRTDTNEINFFRSGTFTVASATGDDETSDTARRDAGAGPFSSDNDQPPGAFAILVEHKGYAIGVLAADDSFYTSKRGDFESWHPKNKFPVARGDGEALTSVIKYGTDILVHKGHATYRLVGDTVPFAIPDPLHSRWGNVSQESAIELNGRLYAWDRERGPYWTDTVNWTSLVDGQIEALYATVNRSVISDIRCAYDDGTKVLRWLVALSGTTRKRIVFKYHVGLGCWLPPDTGLEYASIATFTAIGGSVGTYLGDYWGRVYELNSGEREGVPAGASTTAAAVTSATPSTVTVSGAAFYTTGAGLAGLPVAVLSPAGAWQWRRIESNTADTLTLDITNDAPWTTTPAAGWTVVVGGIQWYQWTPWVDFLKPEDKKSLHWLFIQGRATSTSHNVSIHARFDDDEGVTASTDFIFPTGQLTGVWGSMVWGTSLWGTTQRRMRKQRVARTAFSAQFEFANFYPDQPIELTRYGLTADLIEGRKAPGVS